MLRKALATRPADRWATADEFLRALMTAAPDPDDTGRAALAAALAAALERPAAGRATSRKAAIEAKASKRQKTTTRSSIEAASAAGVRNVLIGAGLLVLLALVLALLKAGLPE